MTTISHFQKRWGDSKNSPTQWMWSRLLVEVLCEENANLIMTETALKFMIEKLGEMTWSLSITETKNWRTTTTRDERYSQILDNSAKFYNKGRSSYPFENPHNMVVKTQSSNWTATSSHQQTLKTVASAAAHEYKQRHKAMMRTLCLWKISCAASYKMM